MPWDLSDEETQSTLEARLAEYRIAFSEPGFLDSLTSKSGI